MTLTTKPRRPALALIATICLLALLSPPALAHHPNPPCFDDHEGTHDFHLTGATAEMEFANDPRLGPYAGKTFDLELDGPTRVDATATSDTTMTTEIIEMALVGTDPSHPELGAITVIENRFVTSPGTVTAFSSTDCYPATSTFDVFFEVRVNGVPAHNDVPKEMMATLNSMPPAPGDVYQNDQTIPFYIGSFHGDPVADHTSPIGWLHATSHTPNPGGGGSDPTVGGYIVDATPTVGSSSLAVVAILAVAAIAVSSRRGPYE